MSSRVSRVLRWLCNWALSTRRSSRSLVVSANALRKESANCSAACTVTAVAAAAAGELSVDGIRIGLGGRIIFDKADSAGGPSEVIGVSTPGGGALTVV